MTWRLRALTGCIAFLACAPAHAAGCYDLSKHEPSSLTGRLEYVLFAGPPNFEDVRKGDTPEPSYVLSLASPICLMGDQAADPQKRFSAVQVPSTTASVEAEMKANLGKVVTLGLKEQMAAETGHHHEPLVAWVTSVQPGRAVTKLDFTDEYGGPATTIRAFYETLGDGQGEVASSMVVPEKRAAGPFAGKNLSRFYGGLKVPIRLTGIDQSGSNEFIAHYRYATTRAVCQGRGLVTTTSRAGKNYIESIKALDGC